MTSIQENKNVEKISMVKPTEAKGGGRAGGTYTDFVFIFHFLIFISPFFFTVEISVFIFFLL